MGLRLFRMSPNWTPSIPDASKKVEQPQPEYVLGEPRPHRFKVNRMQRVGSAVVVEINYPDCKNYNGNKVLVYDSLDKFWSLVKSGVVDPHFLEQSYSPEARFLPTEAGWNRAIAFAERELKGLT